ncbi:p051 [Rhizobium phage 16-3]|uniref:p051 n=1 Tax=Rhizobium phage 16-3 TaxID=10704 RepID=UPI00017BA606|nr:p051 [Rhizobium phage 16-3]ABF71302.1 p051 [Rhizobium phage 16-3]
MIDSDNWSPWLESGDLAHVPPMQAQRQPANDNRKPLMIGITGKRNVGKSTVATILESRYGFARAHAFDGGKEASRAYFEYITSDPVIAGRMVYGDLKDKPSEYLPGGVSPRFFLEKFGHFMGDTMGVDWTLAMEIARIRRQTPNAPIVVESLVYEAPWFKSQGGFVLRLERPDFDGPAGIASDSVQAGIEADETIIARSVDELERKAEWLADKLLEVRKWVA